MQSLQKHIKYFVVPFIFIAGFLFVSQAQAATIAVGPDAQDNDNNINFDSWAQHTDIGATIAVSGMTLQIALHSCTGSPIENEYTAYVYEGTSPTALGTLVATSLPITDVPADVETCPSEDILENNTLDFTFPVSALLDNGDYVLLIVATNEGGANRNRGVIGSNGISVANDSDPNGEGWYKNGGTWSTYGNGTAPWDMFYTWEGSIPAEPSIELLYPPDASSISGDFSHFKIEFNAGGSEEQCGYAIVTFIHDGSGYESARSAGACVIVDRTITQWLSKNNHLQGDETAYASWYNTDDELIATSETHTYSITGAFIRNTGPGSENPIPQPGNTSDDPDSIWYVDCSEFEMWSTLNVDFGFGDFDLPWPNVSAWFPGVVCWSKKISLAVAEQFLSPHVAFDGYFDDSVAYIKQQFPFNIITNLQEEITTIVGEGGELGHHLDATWQFPGGEVQSVEILNDTILNDTLGNDVKEYWFDFVILVSVLAFAFGLYKTILFLFN